MTFCSIGALLKPTFFLAMERYAVAMERIYLDANGSAPAHQSALDSIRAALPLIGNPSSFHEHGRLLRAKLDQARAATAQAIGARAKDLLFCSGASEANRLFCDSLVLLAKERGRPLSVLVSPFEHPSLLKPLENAALDGYFSLVLLEVDPEGRLLENKAALEGCEIFICTQAHNETGIIPDLELFLSRLKENVIVMSDIAQGFARLEPVSARVDVMSFSAQKMGGLAGAGGLVLRANGKKLKAPWLGGNQEGGFRPGTEATLLLLAMGAAAGEVAVLRKHYAAVARLRDRFECMLRGAKSVRVVGSGLARLPNTSAITFEGQDPDALRIACDMAGLSVGFGSACSGLAPEGSFALSRLGMDLTAQKNTVRFSFSSSATETESDEAARRMLKIINCS